jgi:hypothetical protein
MFPGSVVVAFPIAFPGWVSAGNEIDVVLNDEIRGVASEIAAVLGVADEGENFFEGGFELFHDLM